MRRRSRRRARSSWRFEGRTIARRTRRRRRSRRGGGGDEESALRGWVRGVGGGGFRAWSCVCGDVRRGGRVRRCGERGVLLWVRDGARAVFARGRRDEVCGLDVCARDRGGRARRDGGGEGRHRSRV